MIAQTQQELDCFKNNVYVLPHFIYFISPQVYYMVVG